LGYGSVVKKVRPKTLLLLVALVFLGAVPFAQIGGFDFVAYMDRVTLEDFEGQRYSYINKHVIEGLTAENTGWAFSTRQFSQEVAASDWWQKLTWHPLTWLSLLADSTFWKMNPGGFHLTNLFFHLMATVLCYLMTMRLTRNHFVGFSTAALFCLHPIQSTSVAWVSGRPAVLGGFFFLLTMLMYLRYGDIERGNPGRRLYFMLTILACLGAVLSKTSNLVLPLIMVLTDWRFHRKGFDSDGPFEFISTVRTQLMDKWPFFSMGFAVLVIASPFRVFYRPSMTEDFNYGNFLTGVFSSVGHYLEHIFYPVRLLYFYQYPKADFGYIYFAIGILTFLVVMGCSVYFRRRKPQIMFGALWFLICMLPAAGIGHIRYSFTVDYELYIGIIGLFFGFTSLVFRWSGTNTAKSWSAFGVIAVLVATSAMGSYRMTSHWKNTEALVEYTRTFNPQLAGFVQSVFGHEQVMIDSQASRLALDDGLKSARIFISTDKPDRGMELLLSLWRTFPDSAEVAAELAALYEESDPDRASGFHARACENSKNNDARYLLHAGFFALDRRDYKAAGRYYDLAIGAENARVFQDELERLGLELLNVQGLDGL
jgi:hypothetical protein